METKIPRTKPPQNVRNYQWKLQAILIIVGIIILLLFRAVLYKLFAWEISWVFSLLAVPIVMAIWGGKKELTENLYEMVPPYFALVMIDEKSGDKRVLLEGLNEITGNEQPELQDGKKHYLDLKRVIAENNKSTFETKNGGSAKCEWLLAINAMITQDYETTAENILQFNARHSEALFREINSKIMNKISTFYSGHEFEETDSAGKKVGLVYESWVQEKLIDGEIAEYIRDLEKEYGVNISITIYNSNPIDSVLEARNKISNADAFAKVLKKTADGLADQGIDRTRAEFLSKLIFGLTKEDNKNFNVAVSGLENAQHISITAVPPAVK